MTALLIRCVRWVIIAALLAMLVWAVIAGDWVSAVVAAVAFLLSVWLLDGVVPDA